MQISRFAYRIQPHKDLSIGLQLPFPALMSNWELTTSLTEHIRYKITAQEVSNNNNNKKVNNMQSLNGYVSQASNTELHDSHA